MKNRAILVTDRAGARRFASGDWMSAPDWITVKKAVELSGYNRDHIRWLLRKKKTLGDKQSGHDWWIDKASLQSYVREMKDLGDKKFNPYRVGA